MHDHVASSSQGIFHRVDICEDAETESGMYQRGLLHTLQFKCSSFSPPVLRQIFYMFLFPRVFPLSCLPPNFLCLWWCCSVCSLSLDGREKSFSFSWAFNVLSSSLQPLLACLLACFWFLIRSCPVPAEWLGKTERRITGKSLCGHLASLTRYHFFALFFRLAEHAGIDYIQGGACVCSGLQSFLLITNHGSDLLLR